MFGDAARSPEPCALTSQLARWVFATASDNSFLQEAHWLWAQASVLPKSSENCPFGLDLPLSNP